MHTNFTDLSLDREKKKKPGIFLLESSLSLLRPSLPITKQISRILERKKRKFTGFENAVQFIYPLQQTITRHLFFVHRTLLAKLNDHRR